MGSHVTLHNLTPGMTLLIDERDYCYGQGALLLRLTEIGAEAASLPALEWIRLVGDELRHDSGAVYARDRDVLVRVSALAAALRPTGWLPLSGPTSGQRVILGSGREKPDRS